MSYLLLRQLNDAINIQIDTSGKWRILFFPQLSKYGYSVFLGIDWQIHCFHVFSTFMHTISTTFSNSDITIKVHELIVLRSYQLHFGQAQNCILLRNPQSHLIQIIIFSLLIWDSLTVIPIPKIEQRLLIPVTFPFQIWMYISYAEPLSKQDFPLHILFASSGGDIVNTIYPDLCHVGRCNWSWNSILWCCNVPAHNVSIMEHCPLVEILLILI